VSRYCNLLMIEYGHIEVIIMGNKKELDNEQLEQVNGGGDHIWYSDIENVPIGSEIVFECCKDGRDEHRVILLKVDLPNDSVYVLPSGDESINWFLNNCYHKVYGIPPSANRSFKERWYWTGTSDIKPQGDGTYKIYYTKGSTTYFHW